MKIATSILKEAVAKSIKGVSNNNNLPLTSMIGIKLSNGKLRLLSTDMVNRLCVVIDKVAGDDVDITVSADLFAKLISKVTSESVEMSVSDGVLHVKANGNYKIPVVADENGDVIFPDVVVPTAIQPITVKLTSIMNVFNINKASLSNEIGTPLAGYMCTDSSVISTNGSILTSNTLKLFGDDNLLISSQMMHLLTLNNTEDISLVVDNGTLYFVTDNLIVAGAELGGKEDYPVEDIAEYFNIEFNSSCRVPRDLLLSVMDRLMLFISSYDRNCATFTFTRTGINISSKAGSSDELIRYVGSENFKEFSCEVNIPAFKQLVSASPLDTITLFYGDDSVIAIKDGNVSQILALGSDDETEYENE